MTRESLIALLQELPEGTEIKVRLGDEAGLAHVVILDDGTKLTAYVTTFYQELTARLENTSHVEYLRKELMGPYPKDQREVCPHGRSIMGVCWSCDHSDEEEEDGG